MEMPFSGGNGRLTTTILYCQETRGLSGSWFLILTMFTAAPECFFSFLERNYLSMVGVVVNLVA